MSRALSRYDLTSGGMLNKLLLVAVPIMGTQLMQMTYNLTDMFWLGRLSGDAVAASGTAGMFLWLSQAFMMVGRMGAEIGVSQSLGRGEEARARRYAGDSLFLALVLGVLFGAGVIVFRNPLVGFFHIQEAHVARDTVNYLAIVGLGIPFTFVTAAIVGSFNGSGNSRTSFWGNAAGLVVNILLDPLLIFYAGLGIHGAAWATIIAQAIVCTVMLVAMKRDKNRPFAAFSYRIRPSREAVGQIFRWSLPIGMESMLFTLLSMVISRFVASFGAGAMAVSRVGSQIESLSWLIGGGFGSALTAFVGQNYGAGKWSRIRKVFRLSTGVMLVWGTAVTALLFFAGRFLFALFLPDAATLDMGEGYLKILAFCQLAMTLEGVGAGCFKGIGKTLQPSVVSILCNALRVPLAYGLSRTAWGVYGIFLGVTIGALLRGLWCFFWYFWVDRHHPDTDNPHPPAAFV